MGLGRQRREWRGKEARGLGANGGRWATSSPNQRPSSVVQSPAAMDPVDHLFNPSPYHQYRPSLPPSSPPSSH